MLSVDEIKKRLFEIHGDQVILDESTYVNITTKCRFIDRDFGEFYALPHNITGKTNKQKHPKRASTERKDRVSLAEVKRRIFAVHRDECVMDESTFVNVYTKSRFVDKDHGAFFNTPRAIYYGSGQSHPARRMQKIEKTNLEKYGNKCALHGSNEQKVKDSVFKKFGVDNVSKSREVSLKQARGKNQRYILLNWKTNQEIICQSTNEVAVVEWLNQTKQEFDWHIKFNMPNGKVYFCDLYLPEKNLYTEIKGQFYKDAQEKWDWFHCAYSNSELWNEQKLKDLGLWERIKELRRQKRRDLRKQQQSEVI